MIERSRMRASLSALATLAAVAMCVMLMQHLTLFAPPSSPLSTVSGVDTVMLALLHRHDALTSQAADSFATARGRRGRLLELVRSELPSIENDSNALVYEQLVHDLAQRPEVAAQIEDEALLDVLVEHWIYSRRKRLLDASATSAPRIASSSLVDEHAHRRHQRHTQHTDDHSD